MSDGSSLGQLFLRLGRNLALVISAWVLLLFGVVVVANLCHWEMAPRPPSTGSGSDAGSGVPFAAEIPAYAILAFMGVLIAAAVLASIVAVRKVGARKFLGRCSGPIVAGLGFVAAIYVLDIFCPSPPDRFADGPAEGGGMKWLADMAVFVVRTVVGLAGSLAAFGTWVAVRQIRGALAHTTKDGELIWLDEDASR
jgi:hypothetical protein